MSGNALPPDMPQRRKYVLIAGAILCAVLATTAMAWSQGIMINETPSFPQGIYQKYPREARVRRGQMVVACPPDEPIYHLALQRHYLRPGLCPSGTEPLIKKVVGLPGDSVTVGSKVRINGAVIANSTVYPTDGDDRPIEGNAWLNHALWPPPPSGSMARDRAPCPPPCPPWSPAPVWRRTPTTPSGGRPRSRWSSRWRSRSGSTTPTTTATASAAPTRSGSDRCGWSGSQNLLRTSGRRARAIFHNSIIPKKDLSHLSKRRLESAQLINTLST